MILKYIGVDGITAFTIVGYVAFIFSMVLIGFGQGASPLISFTYGAKDYSLTKSLRKINQHIGFDCRRGGTFTGSGWV